MKALAVPLLLLAAPCLYGQRPGTTPQQVGDTTNTISFVTRFHKAAATKDGYYVGPYVVVLDDRDAERFDGKQVRITGTYYVVPGLDHGPVRLDEHGDTLIMQGRADDTGHVVVTGIEPVPE